MSITSCFHRFIPLTTLGVVLISAVTGGRAQTVVEGTDAGETLSTYRVLSGSGALTSITGTIGSNDADLFEIFISNPATFSVSTAGSTLHDPQVFLFRLNGTGILSNDDTTSGNLQSTLPAGDARITALTADNYLLGISSYNRDPLDSAGHLIFDNTFPGLDTPVTSTALDHWSGGNYTDAYVVTLTGTSFVAAIPEPAASAAMGALAIGFCAWRMRRARRRD